MNTTSHDSDHHDVPHDVAGVNAMLDRLGAAERTAMPAGLVSRVVSAAVMASRPGDGVIAQIADGRRVWRVPSMRSAMAMAASLGVMVTAVLLATLSRPSGSAPSDPMAGLEADVELFMQVAWEGDSALQRQINSLRADASTFAESLDVEWDPQTWSFDLESM